MQRGTVRTFSGWPVCASGTKAGFRFWKVNGYIGMEAVTELADSEGCIHMGILASGG